MKINVTGRGRVPGINALAPVYNREADIPLIKRILAYRVFRVFDCESGLQITTKNLCEFDHKDPIPTPVVTKIETPVVETKTIVPEPVVYDTTPEPTEEETPMVEEVSNDEVIVDQSVTDDDIVVAVSDEVVVESTTDDTETTETTDVTAVENETTKEDTINNIRRNRRNRKKYHNNNQ